MLDSINMKNNFLKVDLNALTDAFTNNHEDPDHMCLFERQLKIAVSVLLKENTTSQLFHSFYRLDLPEEGITTILRLPDEGEKVDKITKLIIDRIRKKALTRRQGV